MSEHDPIVQFPLVPADSIQVRAQDPLTQGGDTGAWAVNVGYIPLEHRAVVGEATLAIRACIALVAQNLFEIGRLLIRVRERLKRGDFRNWILREFALKERKAEHLMNIHRRMGARAEIFGQLKPTVLYHLSMPSTPEAAFAVVEDMVRAGHCPNVQEVVSIIAVHKRPVRRVDEGQETIAAHLAETLRTARTALSNQAVADCEQIMGEEAAAHLDELRMELDLLFYHAQSLVPRPRRTSTAQCTIETARALAACDQALGVADALPQLSVAETGHTPNVSVSTGEWVVPGCTVYLRDQNTGEEACYTLIANEPGQPEDGCISWESPVAKALQKKSVGDSVTADTPDGPLRLAITGIRFPDGHLTGLQRDAPGAAHPEACPADPSAIHAEGADEPIDRPVPEH